MNEIETILMVLDGFVKKASRFLVGSCEIIKITDKNASRSGTFERRSG